MDISSNQLKTMKAKELRKIIREAILEVLDEGVTYAGKDAVDDAQKDPKFGSLSGTGKTDALNKLKQGGTVTIGEVEIDEMARPAKGFRLTNPEMDTTVYSKTISGVPLSSILDYINQNPGAEVKSIQTHFQFPKPQMVNALIKGLTDAGILAKLTASGEEIIPSAPGEEAPTTATEPEDMFMGSAENPLSMYFDGEPNTDGSEDFTDDEEPNAGEIEKNNTSVSNMSDDDYEAFMKYNDLKNRLDATKSNILKLRKNKGGSFGDISDNPSTDLQRLRDLKSSLEDKINTLVGGSKYLQNKIEKSTGKPVEVPEVEPIESEDEDVVAENYRYEKRKLQFYAGIIK